MLSVVALDYPARSQYHDILGGAAEKLGISRRVRYINRTNLTDQPTKNIIERTGRGVHPGVAPGGVSLRVGIGIGSAVGGGGSVGNGLFGAGEKERA